LSGEAATGHWKPGVSDSPFLSSDLFEPGAPPHRFTITAVTHELPTNPQTRKEEKKLAAHFAETKLMLVLNVTKGRAIGEIAKQPKMELWAGTVIGLQYGTTKVRGLTVGCIDVVVPPAAKPK